MSKSTVSNNKNQMSFADLGIFEAAPFPAQSKPRAKKAVASQAPQAVDAAPIDSNTTQAFAALLAQTESLASALQAKYEANLTADRIQSRVGISVDVEDVEALFEAISAANKVLNIAN